MRQCVPELLDVGQLEGRCPEQAADARPSCSWKHFLHPLASPSNHPRATLKDKGARPSSCCRILHTLPVLNLSSNTYSFSFIPRLSAGLRPISFLCQLRDILEASGNVMRGRDRPAREGAPGHGQGGMTEAFLPVQLYSPIDSPIDWQEEWCPGGFQALGTSDPRTGQTC